MIMIFLLVIFTMSGNSKLTDLMIDKKINEILSPNAPQSVADEIKSKALNIMEGKSDIDPKKLEGMKDAALMIWTIGLPGVQDYMKFLVNNSECTIQDLKDSCIKKINKLAADRDIEGTRGGMEYKNGKKVLRASYKLCKKDHDLSAELSKLYTMIGDDINNKAKINQSLGYLTFATRSVFTQIVHIEQKMAKKLQEIMSNKYSTNIPLGLQVDPENTTLYIDPEVEKRLGIVVEIDE